MQEAFPGSLHLLGGSSVGEGEVGFLNDKGWGREFLVKPNLGNKNRNKIFIKGKPDFLINWEWSQKL